MLRSGTIFNKELGNNMNFNTWKERVDNLVFKNLSLHCYDLPDEDYWVNWNKGSTPQVMAEFVIKNTNDMYCDSLSILADAYKAKK